MFPGSSAPALTSAEKSRLVRLERTIDRAVEVVGKIAGEALATIRDERLYRITHTSFENYVLDRWGFSRATAYRMIDAATQPALGQADRERPAQRVSPRDKPSTDSGESEAEVVELRPRPITGMSTGMWAEVTAVDPGYVQLAIEPGISPPLGARVYITWED